MEHFSFATMPSQAVTSTEIDYMASVLVPQNITQTHDWLRTMCNAVPTDNELADRAFEIFQYAVQNRSQQRAGSIIAALSTAVRVVPPMGKNVLPQALNNRADALLSQKEYDAAIADWESVLLIDRPPFERTADAYRSIIAAKLRLGRKKEAQDDLNRFIVFGKQRADRMHRLKISQCIKNSAKYAAYEREKRTFVQSEHDQEIRKLTHKIAHSVDCKSAKANGTNITSSGCDPLPPIMPPLPLPFQGYTSSYACIKRASVACSFQQSECCIDGRVLANRQIPRLQNILIEMPLVAEMSASGGQCCESCQQVQVCYTPCFDCHAVVYCSPRCRATNRVQHQVECFSMKTQVLALLDARLLLRLTTAGLRWLANEFAVEQQWKQQQPHKSGRTVRNAKELHEFMCTRAASQPLHEYCNVFNLPPKLEAFYASDFNTCVMTATLLSAFLMKFTRTAQLLCSAPLAELGEQQFEHFLAALVLRHAAQLKQKSLRMQFTITPSSFTSASSSYKTTQTVPVCDSSICTTDTDAIDASAVVQCLTAFDASAVATHVHDYLNDDGASDDADEDPEYLPQELNTQSNSNDRLYVHHQSSKDEDSSENSTKTVFDECLQLVVVHRKLENAVGSALPAALQLYVRKMYEKYAPVSTGGHCAPTAKATSRESANVCVDAAVVVLRSICGSLARFRHSCNANTVLQLCSAGPSVVIALRACRDIAVGEEITISYGVHSKMESMPERTQYLAERAVLCECNECRGNGAGRTVQKYATSFRCTLCSGQATDYRNQPFHSIGEQMICSDCSGLQLPRNTPMLRRLLDVGLRVLHTDLQRDVAATFDTYLRVLVVYVMVLGRHQYTMYNHLLRMAMFLTRMNMAQLAFEFFSEIAHTPRLFYPEFCIQLFDEYILHVRSLCQLLDYNATHNADFYRHNRVALFDPMHALATEHLAYLREIVQIRCLCSEQTRLLNDKLVGILNRLPVIGGRRSAKQQRGCNNIASKVARDNAVSTFFDQFYASIDVVAKNGGLVATRQSRVRIADIFPNEVFVAVGSVGNAAAGQKNSDSLAGSAEEQDDHDACTDAGEKPIFYSTNMNWVWAEEMDDDDD